jgi:hypothetical protein
LLPLLLAAEQLSSLSVAAQAFDLFDTDKSGSIDYHELKVRVLWRVLRVGCLVHLTACQCSRQTTQSGPLNPVFE